MAIKVIYYGNTPGNTKWQRTINNLDDLKKLPFNKKDGHESFKDLLPNTFEMLSDTPGSYGGAKGMLVVVRDDEQGLEFRPLFLPEPSDGLDTTALGITIEGDSVIVAERRAILQSPGAGWTGAEWPAAQVTLAAQAGVIGMVFDPDSAGPAIMGWMDSLGAGFKSKLYTIGQVDGEWRVVRIWNPGDVEVYPMWLTKAGE